MCSRGCLAVAWACFLAFTLCQLRDVVAGESIWSGTSVAINETRVLDGSETLTFQNCTVLLQEHKIILKDRAELRMSDCQVKGKGGIYAYNDSKIDLIGVVWGKEMYTPVNLEAYGASSLRIQNCGLYATGMYLCPALIQTSGNVSIVSSNLSGARQVTGGSVLVMRSRVVGCYYPGLAIGGRRTTILDSVFYGVGEISSQVGFEGDEIYLGSTTIESDHVGIKSSGVLTICSGSRIEARSGGSLGCSDIRLSASSMNISKSSISSWCWGDWWGHLTLTGGSILIVDSDLWSRGLFGEPLGTSLRLTGTVVSVRNSNISAQGYVWPGFDTVSDLSLIAEIIRIKSSFLKCTANRPSIRIEGNTNIVDTEIRVIPPEDTARNRWIIISYPVTILNCSIGPGPEFEAFPSVGVVLSLQPPGPCDEVFIDLWPMGDPKFTMYDDGTHGDLEPNDGKYSHFLYVSLDARKAVWTLPAWSISGGRYGLQTITLTIPVPETWVLIVSVGLSFTLGSCIQP